MAPINIPSDSLKTILAFMDRKELIALSGVNRRFYFLINSLPFTEQPLVSIYHLWLCGSVGGIADGGSFTELSTMAIESVLAQKWFRVAVVSVLLPSAEEAWPLQLLVKQSHCFQGAKVLEVLPCSKGISPEAEASIDKLRTLVESVYIQ